MKKAFLPFVFMACMCAAQAQWLDWHRINFTANYSTQPAFYTAGSGLLRNHPERSVSLGVNYRFTQHWGLGLYTNLVGAKTTSGGDEGASYGEMIRYVSVENGYKMGGGVILRYYLTPFKNRHMTAEDISVHIGADVAEIEADIFWFGLCCTYRVTQHLHFLVGFDVGTFYYGRLLENLTDTRSWHPRSSFGLQVDL